MKKSTVSEIVAPLKRQLDRICDGKAHMGIVIDKFAYPEVVVKAGKKTVTATFCLYNGLPAVTFDGKTAHAINKGTQMADFRRACIGAGLKGVEIREGNAVQLQEIATAQK
jgi:hypothetical protein